MEMLAEFGSRITRLRRNLGFSRAELAVRSGLSARFLADVESGHGNISLNKLASLCQALDLEPAALLDGLATTNGKKKTPRAQLYSGIFSMIQQCNEKQLRELDSMLTRLLKQKQSTIALIGLRGAGKTTVGKRLAAELKWRFVELDDLIEKAAGLTLQNIFELHGEDYYRRLEEEVLVDLFSQQKNVVLATGGGIVMRTETYDLLQRHCWIVWLKADPKDHWNRVLKQDPRPMRNYPDAFGQLQSLLHRRESLYARADLAVDTSTLGIQRSVAAILHGRKEARNKSLRNAERELHLTHAP